MIMRCITALLLLMFFSGCSAIKRNDASLVHLSNNVKFRLLGLPEIHKEIILNQHIKGAFNGQEHSVDAVLKISKNEMDVVALATFGIRIFTMKYDGRNIDFKVSSLVKNNQQIKAEYILADMQLIYYPLDEIRRNLFGNVEVKEIKKNGMQRIFYSNKTPFIKISYSGDDVFKSEIRYQNLVRKYQYSIRNY